MNSALYGSFSFIVISCMLFAAGCAGTSPSSSAARITPASTAATSAGTMSLTLAGVPDVRQAEYYSCGASSYQAVLCCYG